MLLKILGSGTCVISLKRSSPANYLKIGEKEILVDCGPGTLTQLEKAGVSYKDIDMVFITHYHIDHISDLDALIWVYKWGELNRNKDLVIVGPAGFNKFYETYIKPLVWKTPAENFNVIIKEIENEIEFENFTVESCKTEHTEESIAYKFTEKKKSLVISGDTDFSEDLAEFAKGCEVLMLECSFENSMKVNGHLTPKECGDIAKRAGVEKLILTHFYPASPEIIRLNEAQEVFYNTILAEDLMEIKIGDQ
jgi:ribonuclease BN (tRNA processing enzyme)